MRGLGLLAVLTAGLVAVACSQSISVTASGYLTVHVNVTGTEQDTTFTVTVDGGTSYPVTVGQDASFQVNDSTHTLVLGNVASNCTVQSANPQTAQVTADATETVTFNVACTTNGEVAVTTSTTGQNQDDQYLLTFNNDYYTAYMGPQQTLTVSLPVGTYSLELTDVASNCAVQGANPVTVTLVQDSLSTASFQVACTAP